MTNALNATSRHPDANTIPCERCGEPAEFIPYQDQGGCGGAIIEMWRCPNGHVRYGDIIGQAMCDPTDPDTD